MTILTLNLSEKRKPFSKHVSQKEHSIEKQKVSDEKST
jgi:hypothetical protein